MLLAYHRDSDIDKRMNKMKTIDKKRLFPALALFGAILLQAGQAGGEELFEKRCGSCHMKARPADISTLVAPPLPGVAMHVKMKYPRKEDAVAFIEDYVMQPQRKKAQCMPRTIERFGLMPSQKGSVTAQELKKIAQYIVENYPDEKFVRMHRRRMDGGAVKGDEKRGGCSRNP